MPARRARSNCAARSAAWPQAPFAIERFEPYHPWAGRAVRLYASVQFALVLAAAVHFLQAHRDASLAQNLAHAAWIVASLVAIGAPPSSWM